MPHFQVHAPESILGNGAEAQLITALTEAVVDVYGAMARDKVVVEILGVPAGRWGVAGAVAPDAGPVVKLVMREVAFQRPDLPDAPARLIAAVADRAAETFGEGFHERLTTIIDGVPAGRTGVGGVPA